MVPPSMTSDDDDVKQCGFWPSMCNRTPTRRLITGISVCLGLMVVFILIGESLYYCEVGKLCVLKRRSTQKFYPKVLPHGRHWVGLDFSKTEFEARFQHRRVVLSLSTSGGQSITGEFDFTFKHIPEKLIESFETYVNILDHADRAIPAAIKNTATDFSIEDYLTRRDVVVTTYWMAVRDSLVVYGLLLPKESFHMLELDFPPSVDEKNLLAALTPHRTQLAQNELVVQEIESTTQRMVDAVYAESNSTVVRGQNEATKVTLQAEQQAQRDKITAGPEGFRSLVDLLEITDIQGYTQYFLEIEKLEIRTI